MHALEFYSGIGGMHYALNLACPQATVSAAFDINEVANDVYQHNFGVRPKHGNIEKVTAEALDQYAADIWLLAPPCQPYTRRGLKQDADDARARSFLKLLDLLIVMKNKPRYMVLENVVGFETSRTHAAMVGTLQQCGMQVQEFLLTPLQYGIPYSRPRYFCVAKQGCFAVLPHALNGGPCLQTPGSLRAATASPHHITVRSESNWQDMEHIQLLEAFTVVDPSADSTCQRTMQPAQAAIPAGGKRPAPPAPAGGCGSRQDPEHGTADGASVKRWAAAGVDARTGTATAVAAVAAAVQPHSGSDVQVSHDGDDAAASGSLGPGMSWRAVHVQCSDGADDCAGRAQEMLCSSSLQPGSGRVEGCEHSGAEAGTQQPAAGETRLPTSAAAATEDEAQGEAGPDPWAAFWVPASVLDKCADVIDVVTPQSRRANCFTKSYSQYAKGTGSLLATNYWPAAPGAGRQALPLTLSGQGSLVWTAPGAADPNYSAGQASAATPAIVPSTNVDDNCCSHSALPAPAGSLDLSASGSPNSRRSTGQASIASPAMASMMFDGGCGHSTLSEQDQAARGVHESGTSSTPSRAQLAAGWKSCRLRYFTPREVANLHSFPCDFTFPSHVSLRQRYQLLGNSLSVIVVADLLQYVLAEPCTVGL